MATLEGRAIRMFGLLLRGDRALLAEGVCPADLIYVASHPGATWRMELAMSLLA